MTTAPASTSRGAVGGPAGGGIAAWRALLSAALGFFVIVLDTTVVNVALPLIGKDLHASVSGLQWVVDGYTLAFAALLLSAGALADRFGASRCFLLGVSGFTVASAACGLAPTLGVLLTARVLQGCTAALLLPASLSIVREAFPDDRERARAIAVWTAVGGAASAAGPIVGGVISSTLGWAAIFYVNVPVGLVAVALALRGPTSVPRPAPLDPGGQAAAVPALVALTFAMIEAGAGGWTSARVVASLAVFVAAALVFAAVEARTARPLVPPGLFRSRYVSVTTATGAALNLGFYGVMFLLGLYFQQVRHESVLFTGLMFVPLTAFTLGSNLFAGRMIARFGSRIPLVVGQVIQIPGYLGMLAVGPHTPMPVLALVFVPLGLGGGLAVPALTHALIGAVEPERAGVAAGILNCSRQVGGAVGVALFGAFASSGSGFSNGMHIAGAFAAALLTLTAGAGALLPRSVP